jgi:hypothetical protein
MADRTPRDLETREHQTRVPSWKPPSILPDPKPEPGYVFRWVRTSMMNNADNTNVSRQMREGYVPVRAEDHPELMLFSDQDGRFKGNVEVGGLLLCKVPVEVAKQREAYYGNMAQQQMESVDNNLMRENDPRMPLLKPERSSRTTFGRGPRE